MASSSIVSGHKFIQPKKPELKPTLEQEIFSERLSRITRAYATINLDYNPIGYAERYQIAQEKVSLHFQAEYPEYTVKQLLSITRVKLPVPNLFEDPDGKLNNDIKSALVYRVNVNIQREDAVKVGVLDDYLHTHMFTIGRFEAPLHKYTFNDKHEIINSRVVGQTRRYYVQDSSKNIDDILQKFGQPNKIHPWSVAVAAYSGSAHYHNDRIYTVYDFNDWKNTDIDLLIGANENGFLESGKVGRVQLYETFTKKQEERRKQGEILTPKKFLKNTSEE